MGRKRVGRVPTGKMSAAQIALFWSRVARDPDTECWEWTANRSTAGYGYAWINYRGIPSHRLAYELVVGPIPDGLELDHLCRNHGCCNPDHLEPVTHQENMRRGFWSAKTHCPQGHEYTETNTRRRRANGHRVCRTCDNARQNAYREHQAAA